MNDLQTRKRNAVSVFFDRHLSIPARAFLGTALIATGMILFAANAKADDSIMCINDGRCGIVEDSLANDGSKFMQLPNGEFLHIKQHENGEWARVQEDDDEWSCVDDGDRVCGPNNSNHVTAGCYDDGGVLIDTWPCIPFQSSNSWIEYNDGFMYQCAFNNAPHVICRDIAIVNPDPDEYVYARGYTN